MTLVVQSVAEVPSTPRGLLSMRDAMVHVFYNQKAILACLILGLAVGVGAALFTPPKFTAESLVLLRIGATEAAQEGLNGPQVFQGGEAVARALESEVQIVRSDPVIQAAMTRLAEERGGGAPNPKAMAAFAKALKVEIETGSNVMRIAFADEDRDHALTAVQAVIDAYADRRAELYVNASRERQDGEIARYDRALNDTESEIQRIRTDHDVLDIDKDVGLASDRLEALIQRAGQAQERRGAVAAELAAVGRQLASTQERVLDSQERTNSTPNDEARNTLLRLRQDRAHIVEQYNEDWPGLAEIDARIAAAQAQIVENAQDIRSSDRTIRNPVVDLLVTRRASLGIELASLQRQSAELATQLAAARARVADLRDAEMRLHDLERSRSASETIHRSLLIGRAGAALEDQAVDDSNTTVRIVQPPTAPQTGRDLRPTLILAGGALGLALAVATAAAGTAMRQVFIAPGEAESSLGLDALMTIDAAAADPRSGEGRAAIARLAGLLLDVVVDGRPLQVVQFVGDSAPGKSRLALGVAQAMAARGEGSVLLIDLDAADHYRKKAAGAVQRLPAGSTHLDVAQSSSPGLWAAVNPTETPLGEPAATAEEARAFLDLMRGAFGRVVVVASRDFEAPEVRRLYGLADANILILQAESTREPAARRMREVVLASGGDLLGFVLTGRRRYVPEALYRWF
ncbi:exopolysaccharide transport family protein [Brevundimonas sp.]|uniref:exopolysaccharide transport family protein n=1 Tax=Brevundimonas sp. TaxID=1871086 RepID=UPI003D0A72DC